MAAAVDVASRPQQSQQGKRKPFAQWVKSLAKSKNKNGDQTNGGGNGKKSGNLLLSSKHKKSNTHAGAFKNNPYPQSGRLPNNTAQSPMSSTTGHLSFSTTPVARPRHENGSFGSLAPGAVHERELQSHSDRSGAPTLATKAETVHSDAGHSKAATATTHGAFSSTGGAADSTFSSPNQSQHSLTTTLTTIQSVPALTNHNQTIPSQANAQLHGSLNVTNGANPVMFTHQYPVSPAPSSAAGAISAIPRHVSDSRPLSYNSATANGILTDNASIVTLASSSKRRRRSMDTDASVRALAPSSVWGGSRESLPLSVLSATTGEHNREGYRPSMGGIASAERASVYSNSGISAPILASERNSYYSHKPTKDLTDAKSLRSITNIDARSQYDAKSMAGDAKSVNNFDAKSMGGDVGSLRNYEGSIRSGALGHGRNDSIPGSLTSPLASPGLRQPGGANGPLSRRSSDWHEFAEKEDVERQEDRADGVADDGEPKDGVVAKGSRDQLVEDAAEEEAEKKES